MLMSVGSFKLKERTNWVKDTDCSALLATDFISAKTCASDGHPRWTPDGHPRWTLSIRQDSEDRHNTVTFKHTLSCFRVAVTV